MVVPGAAARLGGLAPHQLAEQLEERQPQRARRPRVAAVRARAQHLQLHRLRARAHPRYRAMPARAARHPAPVPGHARSDPPQGRDSRAPRDAHWRRSATDTGARIPCPYTHPPYECCRFISVLAARDLKKSTYIFHITLRQRRSPKAVT